MSWRGTSPSVSSRRRPRSTRAGRSRRSRSAALEKHLPLIEEAGKKRRADPRPAGDLQRPLLLPEPGPKWYDAAEPVPGPTTEMMQALASKHQMAMVVPVYEREQAGVYYNTAAVIDADGSYLGKYRKNHIPHTNGFWEKYFFKPGNLGLPGLPDALRARSASTSATTATSRRARALLGLNGAEIVFNPSATVAGLSQYLWKLEQPAHAVANGYFVAASNRVGTEAPWNIGKFYGTSYVVDPRGNFLATASEDKDELVVATCDLEMIEEVRRTWQFFRDRRPETYGDLTAQAMYESEPRMQESGPVTDKKLTNADVRAKHKQFLFPSTATYYDAAASPSRAARGCRVRDFDGKQVPRLLRRHPDPQRRARERQGERRRPRADGAARPRLDALPDAPDRRARREAREARARASSKKAFFCASGTEADETAVALAQTHTGRQELIALRHGYSGRSPARAVARRPRQVPRHPDAGRRPSSTRTRPTATAAPSASSTRAARSSARRTSRS